MRGALYRLRPDKRSTGHEQAGHRYAVVVQADIPTSTVLVAPTSTKARATDFRPSIDLHGVSTRVLVEQTRAVDTIRLGDFVGQLSQVELHEVDDALRLILGLR